MPTDVSQPKSPRRAPRPTVRFLCQLPEDSFGNPKQLKLLRARKWDQLDLSNVEHPLISDARKRFASGSPDQHRRLTKSVGRPVYEVRSHSGAGWRGAVILDEAGDPWLVYADRHDRFHATAADALRESTLGGWLPTAVEYKLRERDEAAAIDRVWRINAVSSILDALSSAVQEPGASKEALVSGSRSNDRPIAFEITIESDPPQPKLEKGAALATILIRVGTGRDHEADRLLADVLPLLQPDSRKIEATYLPDNRLDIWVELTQAKLAQLSALQAVGVSGDHINQSCLPNEVLHYVAQNTLARALVNGEATRAVCGSWFVPTKDETSDLPVCPKCEERLPRADLVSEILSRSSNETP